jgi:predicted esterase
MSLVLLHGSGGDEHELVPLAADLAPASSILAVRGGIPFDGARGNRQHGRIPGVRRVAILDSGITIADTDRL